MAKKPFIQANGSPTYRFANPQSLTDCLVQMDGDEHLDVLENWRLEYEKEHGETDLTKQYTSQLSLDRQDWLLRHEPRRYFQGLPPFFQEYILECLDAAAEEGRLDAEDDAMIRAYISGAFARIPQTPRPG